MPVACSEIAWISRLMKKLHSSIGGSTTLHADNISAIQTTTNLVHYENIKHIEVACYYIQELVVNQVTNHRHITSHDQFTNMFTKIMTRSRDQFILSKLMLHDK